VEISVHHYRDSENDDAVGIFRHWVTNTKICVAEDCETCANSEQDSCSETTIKREMIVEITYMDTDLEVKDSLAYISGKCIYDSQTKMSKTGKILVAEIFDGGSPAVGADTIAWKWFTEDSEPCSTELNSKQIIGGNLTVHYNPSTEELMPKIN